MSDQDKPNDEPPTPMASPSRRNRDDMEGLERGPIKPTVTVIDFLLPHGGGGGGGGALTYGPGDQEAIVAALDAARKAS